MKIGVDIENTLADIVPGVVEMYNKRYETDYSKKEVIEWGFENTPFEKDKFLRLAQERWQGEYEIEMVEPSLKGYLNEIYDNEQHHIDIVTALVSCDDAAQEWLDEKEINYMNYVVAFDKNNLDYDLFIDDNPNMDPESLILMSQPWNQDVEPLIRLEDEEDLEYWFSDPELNKIEKKLDKQKGKRNENLRVPQS